MKYLLVLLAVAAVALIFSACQGAKKSGNASTQTPTIVLKKGKCRGKCKVYTFSLFEDHSAAFVGVKNVDYIGDHRAQLSKNVYDEIITQLSAADLQSMENEYLSTAKDLIEIQLSYKGKTIRYHNRKAPNALKDIVEMLDEIAFAQAWEAVK